MSGDSPLGRGIASRALRLRLRRASQRGFGHRRFSHESRRGYSLGEDLDFFLRLSNDMACRDLAAN